ncbi:non-specific serine/threonine protein kinase [Trifolium repens]|nr:non-specific serine/threonine protein kinase [Trifolium repens]
MTYNHLETVLALEALRDPLITDPVTDQERVLNEMRTKYRNYFIDYNVGEGATMMPRMFSDDFGDEMPRVAVMTDANDNKFQQLMHPPVFVPPMKFVIDLTHVPSYFVNDLPESTKALSYSHNSSFFNLSHEKRLTFYDISTGFFMLPYDGFGQIAFHEDTTSVKLVDDCGNMWNCTSIYVTFPHAHFKVGGEWSRLVAARRLLVGEYIKIGAKDIGDEQILYLMFKPFG